MINRMKWFGLMALVVGSVACGGAPADDEMVKDLEDDEVAALCEDACSDYEAYSIECMADGASITYSASAGDVSGCNSTCLGLKAAKDSCTATAGDVRVALSTPSSCEEAALTTSANFKLLACLL